MLQNFGELCNGSTTDSDSVCWGSNPYSPANNKKSISARVCSFCYLLIIIGIRTRRERSGRKQPKWLFSPTWATSVSEAIAHGSVRENPYSPAKKKALTLVVGVFFLVLIIGIRTRRGRNNFINFCLKIKSKFVISLNRFQLYVIL